MSKIGNKVDEKIFQFAMAWDDIKKYQEQIRGLTEAIGRMSKFDKYGSHKKAILGFQGDRDMVKMKQKPLLNGLSYEDWKLKGAKLSVLKQKLYTARRRVDIICEEINELI